jgi:hypothetical protein
MAVKGRGIAVDKEGANSAPGDQGSNGSTSVRRVLSRALKRQLKKKCAA